MMGAVRNNTVIAESDNCVIVEGNCHFPVDSVRREYPQDSNTHTECPWKGTASYYTLAVDSARNPDAAWYYPAPKPAARSITNHVAF